MQRIDVLGQESGDRLAVATGGVLDAELDPVLQDVVREVSEALHTPLALVSLVLERTQFFRAHVGLPPDLEVARSTDRDASFCQFVVRDGRRFEVRDALSDERVPQELVERYGIRAYIGEPVGVGTSVLGALCAIDVKERTFTDAERSRLAALAERASHRLGELARLERATDRELVARAVRPAFGEMRNALAPLYANISAARAAAADLGPLVRITAHLAKTVGAEVPALSGLSQALTAFDDLRTIVGDLDGSARRLAALVGALEGLLLPSAQEPTVAEVLDLASALAHHQTKLVGGVAWGPVAPVLRVRAPRLSAVAAVAAALTTLAGSVRGASAALAGQASVEGGEVVIDLRAPSVVPAALVRCVGELAAMLEHDPFVSVEALADGMRLRLPAVTPA